MPPTVFLHQQAVFLLLWAEETDEAPDEVHHPVSYWLSFVQDLSSDSPVFLIKNQIDRQNLLPRPPDLPEGSSPFIQELKVSALRYQGVDTLKGAVMDYLKHHPERWAYDLPSSWLRLRRDLENRQPYKVLPRAHFAQLCLTHEVRHPDTVLKYLHESGFLFYRKGAFQDQIILDQNWMINLIYRLFDPRTGVREEMFRQKGQFSGKDTEQFWPDHEEGDRQVIVNFLTGSRMAFVLDHTPVEIIPFEQQQFVLPALLPTEPPLGVQILGEPQPEEWWVDCSYAFLHRGLIEAIIVRTAQLSPHREWWRDGIIFSDEKTGCQVLARFAPEAGLSSTIRFRLRGTGKAETLAKVRRLLEELHPHNQPEMWVSIDGTQFVSASALEHARQQGKTQVVSRAQDIVEVQPYQMFLQVPKLADNQNVFPDLAAYPRRIRIFVSYAHIDENPYKERLNVTIKNLARRFPIDVWDDRQLFAGDQWEPEILQKLDQADLVCLLISPDFIASDYCFSKEMEKALAKYEQGKGIPIPILIRATSDWEQFPIGRHQALPTPAKPLAQWRDPDEFWASVQLGLRQQIERLLNKNSSNKNRAQRF
ncbi:MAG: TIR domain-containing protein [Nitrospirales bacterium]|nr:TIR domain-containing protein [Nitrospirales bacterium]